MIKHLRPVELNQWLVINAGIDFWKLGWMESTLYIYIWRWATVAGHLEVSRIQKYSAIRLCTQWRLDLWGVESIIITCLQKLLGLLRKHACSYNLVSRCANKVPLTYFIWPVLFLDSVQILALNVFFSLSHIHNIWLVGRWPSKPFINYNVFTFSSSLDLISRSQLWCLLFFIPPFSWL